MTNERARRIVDDLANASENGSIAPPPMDRADEESQLEEFPADDELTEVDDDLAIGEPDDGSDDDVAPVDEVTEISDDDPEDPEALLDEEPADDGETAEDHDAIVANTDETADTEDEDEDAEDESQTAAPEALPQLLEALLFVADEPIAPGALGRALGLSARQVRRGLDDLGDSLREDQRGVRLQQGPDGVQLVTAPEAANAVELFLGLEANRRLSNAALETLAIIAYRQPVTRHVIEQIRGVSSDGAVATLRARGLIEGVGRAPGPGRPLLFATTQRFLEHFGLERPDELPPLPDDVELPPEEHAPQMDLAATEGNAAPVEAGPGTQTIEEIADEVADQLALEDRDGDDTEDEIDEITEVEASVDDDEFEDDEDLDDAVAVAADPELEISGDLEDLSRAAGAAFGTPVGSDEASDGSDTDA